MNRGGGGGLGGGWADLHSHFHLEIVFNPVYQYEISAKRGYTRRDVQIYMYDDLVRDIS